VKRERYRMGLEYCLSGTLSSCTSHLINTGYSLSFRLGMETRRFIFRNSKAHQYSYCANGGIHMLAALCVAYPQF